MCSICDATLTKHVYKRSKRICGWLAPLISNKRERSHVYLCVHQERAAAALVARRPCGQRSNHLLAICPALWFSISRSPSLTQSTLYVFYYIHSAASSVSLGAAWVDVECAWTLRRWLFTWQAAVTVLILKRDARLSSAYEINGLLGNNCCSLSFNSSQLIKKKYLGNGLKLGHLLAFNPLNIRYNLI